MKQLLLFTLSLIAGVAFAQTEQSIHVMQDASIKHSILPTTPAINARHFRLIEIDIDSLKAALNQVHRRGLQHDIVRLRLPLEKKQWASYQIIQNTTMSPELAARFPNIRTYDGYGSQGELVKFDLTSQGFHAMILRPGHPTLFIDPYTKPADRYYMVYRQKDLLTHKRFHCSVSTSDLLRTVAVKHPHVTAPYNSCFLKKYRMALAATYSYTLYTGGTVESALAAETTSMNRVNGIYETDAGITMEIIGNNDAIICTYQNCPTSPPGPTGVVSYTNGNPEVLNGENQINLPLIIGNANYDIGHVLDVYPGNGNGYAGIGVVCNNTYKARGATVSAAPKGDAFDVDYLAHEIGHQFSGTHTQNNECERDPTTSVEPGSGSTIMGYAGICAPNVQDKSGPYFHGISLGQIGSFTQNTATCSTNTAIANAPIITGSNGNSTVPISTPFALNVSATKSVPGAVLTYTWEQMNPVKSPQPPVSTSIDGPNFRSFDATVNPTRYFPNLKALADDGPFTWEVLSSVGRSMAFRISVRNNTAGGSCNAFEDYAVTISATAGPFTVTAPSGQLLLVGTTQNITWNVANTSDGVVNAPLVNILMSTDGGYTYPLTIASGVPNNGSYAWSVPEINTTTGRIMVISSSGTFFNITDNNIAISSTMPTLTQTIRNPLNPTVAFLYFINIPTEWFTGQFTLNGVSGAQIQIDIPRNRFIVSHLTGARQISDVSVGIVANGVSTTTNTVNIPSVLGG